MTGLEGETVRSLPHDVLVTDAQRYYETLTNRDEMTASFAASLLPCYIAVADRMTPACSLVMRRSLHSNIRTFVENRRAFDVWTYVDVIRCWLNAVSLYKR